MAIYFDKLILGENVVIDPTFWDPLSWENILGTNVTIGSGLATWGPSSVGTEGIQGLGWTLVTGVKYRLEVIVSSYTQGELELFSGGWGGLNANGLGKFSYDFTCADLKLKILAQVKFVGSINFISCQEIITPEDNSWASKPQNTAKSGHNDWNYKYKPDPLGTAGLGSIGIGISTEWTYQELIDYVAATAEATIVNTSGILTNFKAVTVGTTVLTDRLLIEVESICDKKGVYLKWLNSNGGYEYHYFNNRQILSGNVSNLITGGKHVSDIFDSNEKDITIDGKSNDIVTVYANNNRQKVYFLNRWIDNFSKWLDFSKSAVKNDVWVFKKNLIGTIAITDYDSTIPNTSLVTCDENHKLQSGDTIYLKETKHTDTDEYEIYLISDKEFYINLVFSSGDNAGYFKKMVDNRDWERVAIRNVGSLNQDSEKNSFDIKFDIITSKIG